jgi:predicted negative regulator of RcsB-dependent stress response
VAELRTEEEQIEAIKSWWKENGKSLVIMIAIAVAAVYGFKAWQKQQLEASENASAMYQQLIAVVEPIENADKAENLATAKHLSANLKNDFSDTQYAKFAALLMAKVAVNAEDLTTAEQELNWLLAAEPSPLVKSIAMIRKAQILAELQKYQEALVLVKSVDLAALIVQAAELEGDIHLAMGNKDEARNAYKKALTAMPANASEDLISLKLNDLTEEES